MAQKIETKVTYVDDLDPSQDATTSKTFEIGTRKFSIDLCEANAERFKSDFDAWTNGLVKRTFTVGKKLYTRWLGPDDAKAFDGMVAYWSKAAKRVRDGETTTRPAPKARLRGTLETILPEPVPGQSWWMDPPRPISTKTAKAFSDARGIVRAWARKNGWPDLGERGIVPHAAYERWFTEVWSAMDAPSWDQLGREAAGSGGKRARRPRRRTK